MGEQLGDHVAPGKDEFALAFEKSYSWPVFPDQVPRLPHQSFVTTGAMETDLFLKWVQGGGSPSDIGP
jgi:hypothetical protein